MTDIFAQLTEAQRTAVAHVDGPLLILAGPGSGKTRVVTHRIANLLNQGVPDSSILALTFTNKAADEMQERVARLVPDSQVWVSTFHRFCARMLRKYSDHVGLEANYSIYDPEDSKRALKLAMSNLSLNITHTPFDSLVQAISWTKNKLITAADYIPKAGSQMGAILKDVYPAYQKQLLQANAVDFDDLLVHIAVILRQSNELRKMLDQRFRYILVDEYQDTNLAQYAIVRSLSIDHPNLAVTGDPDQSIYGWRGANVQNILDFEKDYPEVRVVRLEQNYRSTPSILQVADTLIANNSRRLKKNLFTENPDGAPVRLIAYPTQRDEAEQIAHQIATAVNSGKRSYQDFAIFYRINALSRSMESAFRELQIPYQIVSGVEFFKRKEIKDVFAYLHLLNNPRDDIAFARIVNVPSRKIGKVTVDKLTDYSRRQGCSMLEAAQNCKRNDWITKSTATKIMKFVDLMDRLGQSIFQPVHDIILDVINETGYKDMYAKSGLPEDEDRLANIEELLTDAREYDQEMGEDATLEGFLERTALISDTDAWEQQTDRVTLMTLHAAKGLEFPVVYITAVEQNLIPHDRNSEDPERLEEERRLLFVGITRAESELQLSMAKRRSFRGHTNYTIPSQFMMELPRQEMEVGGMMGSFSDPYAQDSFGGELDFDPPFEDYIDEYVEDDGSQLDELVSFGADLVEDEVNQDTEAPMVRIDPDQLKLGMVVRHGEYGLGKIIELRGGGKNRTARINFASSAGQKTIIIAHSELQLIGSNS